MSVQAQSWAVTQQEVSDPTARHVLLCLANYAGPDGLGAFPSVETLCKDTGLSPRTVQNKLRDLEDLQLIRRGNQALVRAYIRRGDRQTTCYDLDLSRGAADAPRVKQSKKPERGAADAPRDLSRGAFDDATGCISRQDGVHLTTPRGAGGAPNPLINHPLTIKEKRSARKRTPGFDPLTVEHPDWLDRDDWADWVEHRRAMRKPITEIAAREQLRKLDEFRSAGLKPRDVIRHCIANGYQGLFAPSGAAQSGGQGGRFNPGAHVNRNRIKGGDYDRNRTIDM